MSRGLHGIMLSVVLALIAAPVLAAGQPSATGSQPMVTLPPPAAAATSSPAPLRPVSLASTPFQTTWNETLLASSSPAMGLQTTGSRGQNNHVRWAIAGAAIGAIVGAVADDPLRDAAIGGAVGFGLSYVTKR